jgi:hypothetical protein
MIQVPRGASTIDTPSSTIWLSEEGILYSVGKNVGGGTRSTDEIRNEMDLLRSKLGDRKYCIIIESNARSTSPPKDQRDLIASELNSITKAMAIVSGSPLSRMVANLFFSFKPPSYPMKIFSSESDAKRWITQYL